MSESRNDELEAWCALLRAETLGPARARALVECTGSAAAARAAGRETWRACGVSEAAYRALESPDAAALAADRAWLALPGHHLVPFGHPDYPPLLARLADAPAALFVAGDPALLWQPQLAIVGARSATPAGLALARDFATTLARAGLAITSGLADGVDGAAHRAALDAGGTTIAVCGTGLAHVYPRRHEALAREIETRGALVSEFPLDTDVRADQFPRRNRIIAGLALGVLVVEAGLRSGSLITARLAGECGREVFAVPGSIHNPLARGCHRLIRQGATLVESAEDVVAELGPLAAELATSLRARLAAESAAPVAAVADADASRGNAHASRDRRRLLDAIGHDAPTLDALVERCELTAPALSSMLLLLELEGAVAALPGGRYQRLVRG